jgi:hypothetical protein
MLATVPSDTQTVAKDLDVAKTRVDAKVRKSFGMRVLRVGQRSPFVDAWPHWSWPDVFVVNWPIDAAHSRLADTTDCMNF